MQYLADHNIDRNKVAQQLSHIFSRMIYITGMFSFVHEAGLALTLMPIVGFFHACVDTFDQAGLEY